MSIRSAKKPKDSNAPKKSQSSYFIFSNERRSILQAENKDKKITEISKLISAEWKTLSDEDKKEYERRAVILKKKYLEDLEEYKKTDNYTKHQMRLKQWEETEKNLGRKKGKAPKKPKQPDAMPKRPQSSYFIFSNSRRNELRVTYPNKKITELSKLISEEWKIKTPEDKKQYEDKAEINKAEYQKNIKIYKETEEFSIYDEKLREYKLEKKRWEKSGTMDVDDDIIKVSMPRKPKDKLCPKKPLTSYFLYASKVRAETKSKFPDMKITEIAKEISKQWNTLTDDEKKPHIDGAAELKEIYKKKIAEYKDSDNAKAFALKLNAWKEECNKRRQDAKNKQLKKKQAAAAAAMKAKSTKKGRKSPRKSPKNRRRRESSSDESSSYSSSDSESDSDSSSGSGSSDSDSDSDSSSE